FTDVARHIAGHAPYPAIQRFADGGGVWRVPGVGNTDSVPALLPSGGYVLKKSSSGYYGQDLISQLVQRYATGGVVNPNLTYSQSAVDAQNAANKALHDLKVQADNAFGSILDRATNLPLPTWGQDVRDYVWRAREIANSASDQPTVQALI